ncbi:unnamed protein product [Gulo gulo]|jgi:4-hydroxyphenylpyruvate dioxygenase
MERS